MREDTPKRNGNRARVWLGVLVLLLSALCLLWNRSNAVKTTRVAGGPSAKPAEPQEAWRLPEPKAPRRTNRAATATTAAHVRAQKILSYGSAEGEVGLLRGQDRTPIGPESFTVAADGTILLADLVNHRVALYSSDGAYLRSVDFPGITLNDVMADAKGGIYVYDQKRQALYPSGAASTASQALALSPADIATRGYFHIVNGSVYFADAAARDILVATVQEGALHPPDQSQERTTDGIHAESGRIYSLSVVRDQTLQLQVRAQEMPAIPRRTVIPIPGVLSARFVGEDDQQRFYVETERLVEGQVAVEVLTFDSAGSPLAATRLPENDYALWTAKLVEVARDGTIVQFLPAQNQPKLYVFASQ